MKQNLLMIIAAFMVTAFSTGAYALGLPDTGQFQCYDHVNPNTLEPPAIVSCAGTGQDGEFLINAPSYGSVEVGTVIDNNTGLMWQKEDDNTLRNLSAATTYCENLTLGGLDGWRVPAMRELFGIVDFSRSDPAINPVFTNTKSMCYWARDFNFPLYAKYGFIWQLIANQQCGPTNGYVRCVRGESFDQVLTDNINGTVTDHRTGLIWQKAAIGPYPWPSAITACSALALADANDWRLPNLKEIQSLLDRTLTDMINPDYFPDYYYVSNVWTSTTRVDSPRYAFHLDLWGGETLYGMKIDDDMLHKYVRCVRGGGEPSVANLTVNAAGAGHGRIMSSPAGISYNKPSSITQTQTKTFVNNTAITVTATAIGGATVSWSGTCTAAGGIEGGNDTAATCDFSALGASKTITADFPQTNPMPPVMTVGVLNFYDTITEAYAQAETWDMIKTQAVTLTEDLTLDRAGLLILSGGYSSDFGTNTGYTTINGNVAISGGQTILDRIICNKLSIQDTNSPKVDVRSLIIR